MSLGQSSQNFYFKSATPQSLTFTVAATGFASASLSPTVFPAPASQLIVSGVSSFSAGRCVALTLATQDAYGNTASVSSATGVNLSGNNHGTYYSDSNCTTSTTSLTLSSGASTKTFYFKDSTSESAILTASASGFTPGTLSVTINPDTTPQLVLSGLSSATAGLCYTLNIATIDGFGNTIAVGSNTTITLSNAGISGAFYTTSSCATSTTTVTMNSGSSSQTTYLQKYGRGLSYPASSSQWSWKWSALGNGATRCGSTNRTFRCDTHYCRGVCSAFTMTAEDAYGNTNTISSPVTVTLSNTGSRSVL